MKDLYSLRKETIERISGSDSVVKMLEGSYLLPHLSLSLD